MPLRPGGCSDVPTTPSGDEQTTQSGGGQAQQTQRAISFVLHRIHGIGSPRGFILFSRCQFSRRPNRSGFKRMRARGRGETAINANHFSGVVTAARSFSLKSATFLLEWFVMMIEVPKRSFYVSNSTEERTLRENWNIEASRTIAGALTRQRLRCHVASGSRKSAKINEILRLIFLLPAWQYPSTRPGRQASEVHAAAAKARQAGSRQEKLGDFQVKTAVFG